MAFTALQKALMVTGIAGVFVAVLVFGLAFFKKRPTLPPLAAPAFLFILCFLAVSAFTVSRWDAMGGGAGVLTTALMESYGMLFDILVICGALFWLQERGRVKEQIERHLEEIDDFRGWRSPEAAHRLRGVILRLNKKNVFRLDLSRCHLRHMNLKGVLLAGSCLVNADLLEANLSRADLSGADLQGATAKRAFLYGANLRETTLWAASFSGANLEGADLYGALMKGADLSGANLSKANLSEAKGLTASQLCEARTLHEALMPESLKKEVAKLCPHVFEPPV